VAVRSSAGDGGAATTHEPAAPVIRRRGSEGLTALAFLAPALLCLGAFRVYPALHAVWDSFHSSGLLTNGRKEWVGFDNYSFLFHSPRFGSVITATIKLVGITVVFQTVLALLLALLLSGRVWGAWAWRTVIVLPIAVPIAVSSVVWGVAFRPDGPINGVLGWLGIAQQPFLGSSGQAPLAIVAILSWVGVGYWMIFLVAGLQDIPRELNEAAAVDGAGKLNTFWHVTLPQLRRPLAFVLVANTVANVLVFAPTQILTKGGPEDSTRVVMYDIYTRAFTDGDTATASAEIVLMLIVLLTLVAVQLRLLQGRKEDRT
jgi:multiple sugar transport system permease protein